jgi:hypothetical protein
MSLRQHVLSLVDFTLECSAGIVVGILFALVVLGWLGRGVGL